MPLAIRLHRTGGPDVLGLEEFDPGKPAAGEVLLRHTAVGLNFIDVYDRTGLYPMALPAGLGREAAGVVTALGRGVKGLRVGDRVAYVHTQPGTYCELRNVPAERLVKIPKDISDEQAAAIVRPLVDRDGRLIYYLGVQYDITAQVSANAEIDRLRLQLGDA